jgi:hypothetical protein
MRIFGIVIACLFFLESLLAQNKIVSLTGTVCDLKSKEVLIGSSVWLMSCERKDPPYGEYGAATDVKGRFIITKVPPGRYTLHALYIGYQRYETAPFTLYADSTYCLDILLDPYQGLTAEQAREDIKKGVIRIYMWASMIGYSKAHADLAKEYGFEIGNTGCTPIQTARYDSVMVQYLASRNGKGWFDRFLKEWNKIKWP